MLQHFKDLNKDDTCNTVNTSTTKNYESTHPDSYDNENSMINCDFDEDEIIDGICKLKNNKACGYDGIVNEFIKDAADLIAPILTKIFNLILNAGLVLAKWSIGIITAVFKNKGSSLNPDN